MTTTAQVIRDYDDVVRLKVSWTVYNALVDELGDNRHARLTYDGETLEILSPVRSTNASRTWSPI